MSKTVSPVFPNSGCKYPKIQSGGLDGDTFAAWRLHTPLCHDTLTGILAMAAQASPCLEGAIMLQVACTCGKRFKASDEYAGKRATCPQCGQSLLLSPDTTATTASMASPVD